MRFTRQHKLFHIAVFGAIAALAVVFMVLQREYRAAYEGVHTASPMGAGEFEQEDAGFLSGNVAGATTPEETFGKFIAALKMGDVALASRHMAAPRQAEWRESLALLEAGGGLGGLAGELEVIQQTWKKGESDETLARFTYEKPLHDGTKSAQVIVFEKDAGTGAWRIREL